MIKVAVLGSGMVGSAIALDLSKNFNVTAIDRSETALQSLQARNSAINTIQKDLLLLHDLDALLLPFDLVVSAVPGFMGYNTLKAIIQAKKNVVDISFFPENSLDLNDLAIQNNVTAIVDCGVAPGMSNLVLGYWNEHMEVEHFEFMVGGLPKVRTKPFEYKAPFSPIDVIEEYTRPARYIENGNLVIKPALSDACLLDFEKADTLESFNTDGLRTLLFTMNHIPNLKEKTLRYPGHISLIQALISAGFFDETPLTIKGTGISPLEFSSCILFKKWKLEEGEDEFTIMQIKISGIDKREKKTVVYDLYDENDRLTNTSSMARTTGYTCSAALHLLANKLFDTKGICPPEMIGKHPDCYDFIFKYLEERNVHYKITQSSQ